MTPTTRHRPDTVHEQANGAELNAPIDDQERQMLDLAAGRIGRRQLIDWLRQHVRLLA